MTAITLTSESVLRGMWEGIRFLENFFDNRGHEATRNLARFGVGSVMTLPTELAWNEIQKDFAAALNALTAEGFNWIDPMTGERFEAEQETLAITGNQVIMRNAS